LAGPPASPFLRQMEQPRAPDEPWDDPRPVMRTVASARPAPAAVSLSPADASLRDLLKRWRSERARSDGVPAYVVFNDSTLDEIAVRRPATLAELGQVKGIGPTKLDRYGDEVLALVAGASPG